jgi:subtilisin family serine protease
VRLRLFSCIQGLFILGMLGAPAAHGQPGPEYAPGRLLVGDRQGVRPEAADRVLDAHRAVVRRVVPEIGMRVVEVPAGSGAAAMASLIQSGAFRYVERDYYARTAAVPDDPSFPFEWHLAKIQAPQAWDINTGSPSVVVAAIDSGADAMHPDLQSKLVPGWNFLTSTSDTSDGEGHGTAVAGTIAAAANNGIGVAGVTWGSKIMPLVVVDSSGSAAYSDIATAIQYAADHGARVINISIGGTAASAALQSAVDYAWSKGSVVFAAAMNNSTSTPYYPAACNGAVAVSATDSSDNLASFSNYGSWVTISAPGANILTTSMGGSYGYWSGTSFSSPIAAGVAALALAAKPSLTNAELVALLEANADDLGTPGYDPQFGFGRVNAYRTVAAAQQSAAAPAPAPVPVGFEPIRVNAGGPAYVDARGQTWSADTGYTGGYKWASSAAVEHTASPGLYQTCRYGAGLVYRFDVPDGAYTVTLKFAELSATGPGQRVFNAAIDGAPVLANFDIFAEAGGADMALDKSFAVSASGGQISIEFDAGPGGWPEVNAIEIVAGASSSANGSAGPPRVSGGAGTYTAPRGRLWGGPPIGAH